MNGASLVSAAQAQKDIGEAFRELGKRYPVSDAKAAIWTESPDQWCIGVTFCVPNHKFLWWTFGKQECALQFTGHAQHTNEAGVRSTDSEGSGRDGTLYVIWAVLDCIYLWNGESFDEMLAAITQIGGRR